MAVTDRSSAPSCKPRFASVSAPKSRLRDCAAVGTGLWALWRKRRAYRRDLRRLLRVGPRMLADIGLTLEEAQRESAKPFWRA